MRGSDANLILVEGFYRPLIVEAIAMSKDLIYILTSKDGVLSSTPLTKNRTSFSH